MQYGREFGEIPEEEPVILLRAQDRVAIEAARFYLIEAHAHGADPKLLKSFQKQLDLMIAWPKRKRCPDL